MQIKFDGRGLLTVHLMTNFRFHQLKFKPDLLAKKSPMCSWINTGSAFLFHYEMK